MGKRFISAFLLILILLPVYLAGGLAFTIALGIIALLALKEMLDLRKSHSKIPNGIVLISMCVLLFLVIYEFGPVDGIPYLVVALLSLIFLLPTLFHYKSGEYETKDAFYLIGVIAFLGMAFHYILNLRRDAFYILSFLLLIPIVTDTCAMMFGSFFGHKKIAPIISPNKTYVGTFFGTLFGTVFPSLFYYFLISKEKVIEIVILSFLLSIVGQLGDLLFSKIKRENEIKDFSNLIPGHGGVLDRFDSSIFVILAFMILKGFIR